MIWTDLHECQQTMPIIQPIYCGIFKRKNAVLMNTSFYFKRVCQFPMCRRTLIKRLYDANDLWNIAIFHHPPKRFFIKCIEGSYKINEVK